MCQEGVQPGCRERRRNSGGGRLTNCGRDIVDDLLDNSGVDGSRAGSVLVSDSLTVSSGQAHGVAPFSQASSSASNVTCACDSYSEIVRTGPRAYSPASAPAKSCRSRLREA